MQVKFDITFLPSITSSLVPDQAAAPNGRPSGPAPPTVVVGAFDVET
jgi:hypothetical protein